MMSDLLFEAEITPYRSLSRAGLWRLIGFLCTVSFGVTLMFWWLGAWPIAGFNGAELLAAVLLLRVHGRSRRVREEVRLTSQVLRVRRVDARGGVTEVVLSPDWLDVLIEERAGRVPALWLVGGGVREEIAAVLGEDEKRDLARVLGQALHRRRHPVFDNPQLRDDVPASRSAPST